MRQMSPLFCDAWLLPEPNLRINLDSIKKVATLTFKRRACVRVWGVTFNWEPKQNYLSRNGSDLLPHSIGSQNEKNKVNPDRRAAARGSGKLMHCLCSMFLTKHLLRVTVGASLRFVLSLCPNINVNV